MEKFEIKNGVLVRFNNIDNEKEENMENLKLLKNWDANWEKCNRIVSEAAWRLLKNLNILYGEGRTPDELFGLPYTSASGYGAIWNCNASAVKKNDNTLFFKGIALTEDFKPVALFNKIVNGEEIENDLRKEII